MKLHCANLHSITPWCKSVVFRYKITTAFSIVLAMTVFGMIKLIKVSFI